MQIMTTTLMVRVPIKIENMKLVADATELLRKVIGEMPPESSDGISVTLTQRVTDDAETATPAPRRRGPTKKASALGNNSGTANAAPLVEPAKDTSKPGTETTQPAWKVQASSGPTADPAQPKRPPFLDRTAGTANAGKAA